MKTGHRVEVKGHGSHSQLDVLDLDISHHADSDPNVLHANFLDLDVSHQDFL